MGVRAPKRTERKPDDLVRDIERLYAPFMQFSAKPDKQPFDRFPLSRFGGAKGPKVED